MSKISQSLNDRSKLIKILNNYRQINKIDNVKLNHDINTIAKIKNKEFVFKTILQEFLSSDKNYQDVCLIILLEILSEKELEEFSLNILKDNKTEDSKKLLVLSLLKEKNIEFNYKDIAFYINDAESLACNGIREFLKNITNDPDIQIDLLDFFINISNSEKELFLENLQEEYKEDELASAFSILAQLNHNDNTLKIILSTLLNNSSPYAIDGLEYILKHGKIDTKTRAKIKNQIKKLNSKFPNFSNQLFSANSTVDNCYISFIDGNSNFSLVFTRKRNDETLNVLLLTANIKQGITSCMGFYSINLENFTQIMKRLFNDSIAVKINPVALKSLYSHYIEKSFKNNIELPYELIVWKNMLNDIRQINYDISEFINSKLDIINLTEEKVKKLTKAKITETWYYSYETNKYIDELIANIENEHLTDLNAINQLTQNTIKENFLSDKEFKKELLSKLLLQSYIAYLAKLKITSACLYTLCFKKSYMKILIESSIDKSLYYYFSTRACEHEEKNIFKKEKPTNFTKKELESLMMQLEEKWN